MHNSKMTYADTNRVVKEHIAAAKALRIRLQDPAEARRFLIRAGIAKACKTNPDDVQILKRFR